MMWLYKKYEYHEHVLVFFFTAHLLRPIQSGF